MFSFIILSCTDDTPKYKGCDEQVYNFCNGKDNVDFCTFGYKWGQGNPYSDAGPNNPGPQLGNVTLTYKFMEAGFTFSTHSAENLVSIPFENATIPCVKDEFKRAFKEWASVAKIDFREASSNETADLKIIIAELQQQSSLGYGNYPKTPCIDIKGLIIFDKNDYSCPSVYGAVLHEIGHSLGLGHVNSNNVMHPSNSTSYSKLQPGDIKGIQSIYGAR